MSYKVLFFHFSLFYPKDHKNYIFNLFKLRIKSFAFQLDELILKHIEILILAYLILTDNSASVSLKFLLILFLLRKEIDLILVNYNIKIRIVIMTD